MKIFLIGKHDLPVNHQSQFGNNHLANLLQVKHFPIFPHLNVGVKFSERVAQQG